MPEVFPSKCCQKWLGVLIETIPSRQGCGLRLAIESRRPFKGLSQEPACSKWHVPGNGDAIAKVAQTSSAAGIGAAICAVHQAGQGRAQRLIESSGTEGIAAQQLVAMTQNPRQSDELHASPGR